MCWSKSPITAQIKTSWSLREVEVASLTCGSHLLDRRGAFAARTSRPVAMSKAKQGSKRKHPARKALPMLGAAGLTLSLAGATALPAGPVTDLPRNDPNDLTLGEEEIADVSLATFYVFDKEIDGTSMVELVGRGCHGCHGCGGCGGCRAGCGGCHHGCGCHGCGGCGGCG